jgi:hypothetical protein
MATYNTLDALVHTWSPRFVLFLDEEQWEPYDGPKYVADKAMMWKKRGPRRHARYAMERSNVNSDSVEDSHEVRCSKCHNAGHIRERCEENVHT